MVKHQLSKVYVYKVCSDVVYYVYLLLHKLDSTSVKYLLPGIIVDLSFQYGRKIAI